MTDQKVKVKDRNAKFDHLWDNFCEMYGNGYDQKLAKHFFTLGYSDQHLELQKLKETIEEGN